jgi:Extensin-like protein C-terminus
MKRGVRRSLVSSVVLVALIAVAGCSHYFFAEREPWRHEAEVACLNSGAVRQSLATVRISAINGPGVCGMDYPLRVSALGESAPLGYTDEPPRPPSLIPPPYPPPLAGEGKSVNPPPLAGEGKSVNPPPLAGEGREGAPQRWPVIQSNALPPARSGPPHPYYGAPSIPPPPLGSAPVPPLGPPPAPPPYPPPLGGKGREGVAAAGPVDVKPPATLACPIVSALDQWVSEAVQPAALHWFGQPVVEIKQISSYSCRGMNGNPNAHISEHAFGNALDIAGFELADGHRISVQYGWHGTPQEQGFLRDVQAAACSEFTTVLAPGANVYHYNHIHVDLMRHAGRRHICEPAAVPGEVVAARARARYAAQHGEWGVTGSIKTTPQRRRRALGYSGADDDSLPLAVPGDD